jgi:hypothetical protein
MTLSKKEMTKLWEAQLKLDEQLETYTKLEDKLDEQQDNRIKILERKVEILFHRLYDLEVILAQEKANKPKQKHLKGKKNKK